MFSTDMFGTNIFGSGRTEWIIPEPQSLARRDVAGPVRRPGKFKA